MSDGAIAGFLNLPPQPRQTEILPPSFASTKGAASDAGDLAGPLSRCLAGGLILSPVKLTAGPSPCSLVDCLTQSKRKLIVVYYTGV